MTPTPNTEGQPMNQQVDFVFIHPIEGEIYRVRSSHEGEPMLYLWSETMLGWTYFFRPTADQIKRYRVLALPQKEAEKYIGQMPFLATIPTPPEPVKEREGKLPPCPFCNCFLTFSHEEFCRYTLKKEPVFKHPFIRWNINTPPCPLSELLFKEKAWRHRTPPVQDERLGKLVEGLHKLCGLWGATSFKSFDISQLLRSLGLDQKGEG